ncbi:hypothetical protein HYS54_03570 [Candidatus Micrarchaeota archaeon]|nr:hypothetical protein [Candidatus Micrarchaeota archaeon]
MRAFFLPTAMLAFIVIFGVLMLIPVLIGLSNPLFKWVFMAFMAISIFTFVTRIIGMGWLAYVISAILIYIFVVNLWWLLLPGTVLYFLIAFGLSGIILFSLPHGGGSGIMKKAVG